jgi:hypothetical protein
MGNKTSSKKSSATAASTPPPTTWSPPPPLSPPTDAQIYGTSLLWSYCYIGRSNNNNSKCGKSGSGGTEPPSAGDGSINGYDAMITWIMDATGLPDDVVAMIITYGIQITTIMVYGERFQPPSSWADAPGSPVPGVPVVQLSHQWQLIPCERNLVWVLPLPPIDEDTSNYSLTNSVFPYQWHYMTQRKLSRYSLAMEPLLFYFLLFVCLSLYM